MRARTRTIGLVLALGSIVAFGITSPLFAQCEPTTDCNGNLVLDSCDLALGTSDDCDGNGIPDECDISGGSLEDCNLNGIPDICEPAPPVLLAPTGGLASATSVAIRNNTAVVGSTLDSTGAPTAGAVHVFRRVGTTWQQNGPTLVASDAATGDLFGSSVSTDGDFIAVGAPGDDIGTVVDAGAVYIFRRSLGTWIQVAKLSIPSPLADDEFGSSVTIRGNRLIAGAPMGGSIGPGKAVIFSFDGLSWSIDALLQPAGLQAGDFFGSAVGLGFQHAFVGAWGRPVAATAVAGEVFVYELSGTWAFDTTLSAPIPQTGSMFGSTLRGNDTTLIVGAPNQDALAGAAHLFEKTLGVWGHTLELTSPATTAAQRFGVGIGLGIAGGRVIIGEDETFLPAPVAGMAHVYRQLNGAWSYQQTVLGNAVGDGFGRKVATDGRYAVISSPGVPASTLEWIAPAEDCNGNAIDDFCDISQGVSSDCNGNTIPDSCDLATGTSADCDGDQTPDECELAQNPSLDCNGNGVLDSCDIGAGLSLDCNGNGFPDECDIASGAETDCDGNAVPDSCQGISDTVDPVITGVPGNISVSTDAGLCSATVTWTEPTITDSCGISSVVQSHVSGGSFPVGTTIVTYTATDIAGNSSAASFTVTVTDTSGPSITGLPSSFTVPSTPGLCSAVVTWTPPIATDGCGLISLTSNVQPGATRPVGVTTVTYTAIDVHGNSTVASFTVTIEDQVAPTIVGLPGNQNLVSLPTSCGAIGTWTPPGVTDNCASATLTSNFASGTTFPIGTSTVTYTATDASGNTTVASFTITVTDPTAPVISGVPADQTLFLGPGSCSTIATWTAPTATDNCGIQSLVGSPSSGASLTPGVHVVTYMATDIHGNVTSASFVITVIDAELPVFFGVPSDISLVLAPGTCAAVAIWAPPTATDNCAVVSLIGDSSSGFAFPAGVTVVSYTATDPSGNTATASFTVTVIDLEAPTIPDLPIGVVAGTDAPLCQAAVTWTAPLGADNCTIASVITSHSPGDLFPVGNTVVSVTVTDSSGNSASGSFTVTVIDDDPPAIIGLPASLDVSTDPGSCGAIVTWTDPTLDENCSGETLTSSHLPGDLFPLGATDVTYLVSDAAGNQDTVTFTVTVTDTELPTITGVPADTTVGTDPGACSALLVWTPPTASDNCALQIFSGTHIPGQTFAVGQTVVTYTATDVNGGTAQQSFTITVADNTAPTLNVGADITVATAPGECIATVTVPIPTAADNCGIAAVTNDFTGTGNASGDYPIGTTAITWTAVDVHGNPTVVIQQVTVNVPPGSDCNANGVPDDCDITFGTSPDCNANGIPDECDLTAGTSLDQDGDGIPDECAQTFVRGDINDDGTLNIADSIFLLTNLFVNGPQPHCLDAADANDDGLLDISDVIFTINYIFVNGPTPPPPFPACGLDLTPGDSFGCAFSSPCP